MHVIAHFQILQLLKIVVRLYFCRVQIAFNLFELLLDFAHGLERFAGSCQLQSKPIHFFGELFCLGQGILASSLNDLRPLPFDILQPAAQFVSKHFGIRAGRFRRGSGLHSFIPLTSDLLQQAVLLLVFQRNSVTGPINQTRIKPQSFCNRQRVRTTRQADAQAIGRSETLQIKLHACIAYAGPLMRV